MSHRSDLDTQYSAGAFRPRRLRRTAAMRRLVRETTVTADDLILPIFVTHGAGVREPIESMPGCYRWSVDRLQEEIEEAVDLGLPAVIVFGIPEHKDARGSGADDPDGIAQRAIRRIKKVAPQLLVIGDVCLCEYTDHGHCGLLAGDEVDNDATLERLAAIAVAQAVAGADVVAPSDMMDGRVGAIRDALEDSGFHSVAVLSYAAKYCSSFYGPFRDAAGSAPQFGDRRGYQMDPPNQREALREISLDIDEGADMVMVKPALAYLDVLSIARAEFDVPLVAYNVSGEYALVKAAAERGWIDEGRMVAEIITSIKRAGADAIITYHAKDLARRLRDAADG